MKGVSWGDGWMGECGTDMSAGDEGMAIRHWLKLTLSRPTGGVRWISSGQLSDAKLPRLACLLSQPANIHTVRPTCGSGDLERVRDVRVEYDL